MAKLVFEGKVNSENLIIIDSENFNSAYPFTVFYRTNSTRENMMPNNSSLYYSEDVAKIVKKEITSHCINNHYYEHMLNTLQETESELTSEQMYVFDDIDKLSIIEHNLQAVRENIKYIRSYIEDSIWN